MDLFRSLLGVAPATDGMQLMLLLLRPVLLLATLQAYRWVTEVWKCYTVMVSVPSIKTIKP